jgi:hypothetical protein
MNKRQTLIIRHILTVLIVTLLFIFGLINLRDTINRSECMREMSELGKFIQAYRTQNGSLPPESWLKPRLGEFIRLGDIQYRARYVLYDSPGDTILAHAKQYSSAMLVKSGYVILQLDGQVKWMPPDEFRQLIEQQENKRNLELFRLYGEPKD